MIMLNGSVVKVGSYPNGEQYVPLEGLNIRAYNKIEWMYEDDSEFVALVILHGHLSSYGRICWLKINYMPHSRMDRDNMDYAFSLKYVSKIINAMKFDRVEIKEPHSDVCPALIDNVYIDNWCISRLSEVILATGTDSLFFPDAGAAKRYSTDMPYSVGIKKRNFRTGEIVSFDYHGNVGKNVLIVDDLCSRGGTFVHSSNLLRGNGAQTVSLLVAHCEQTVFEGELFDKIDMMYTSRSNLLKEHKQITII